MFWLFLLAHLIGDYPLQTDRIVAAKRTVRGLLLHVLIHLSVLLLLTVPVLRDIWFYLLLIAGLHYAIDALKNTLNRRLPSQVGALYLLDQLLHLLSLLMVGSILATRSELVVWLPQAAWVPIATGALLVSYVWYISERVLLGSHGAARARMIVRIALFALLLMAYWPIGVAAVLLALLFYRLRNYPVSWLLIDCVVVVTVTLLAATVLRL